MTTPKRTAARLSARSEVAFKRQLVQAREAAKLSQRRLAELMDVDHSTISRMERLDSNPRLSDLRAYLTQCSAALELAITPANIVMDRACGIGTDQEVKAHRLRAALDSEDDFDSGPSTSFQRMEWR